MLDHEHGWILEQHLDHVNHCYQKEAPKIFKLFRCDLLTKWTFSIYKWKTTDSSEKLSSNTPLKLTKDGSLRWLWFDIRHGSNLSISSMETLLWKVQTDEESILWCFPRNRLRTVWNELFAFLKEGFFFSALKKNLVFIRSKNRTEAVQVIFRSGSWSSWS